MQAIIKHYQEYFPLDKIKTDLFEYLDEMMTESKQNETYIFEIIDIDHPQRFKTVKINTNDTLTIYRIQSRYEFEINMYFFVTVAIGKYIKPDQHGLYSIEKCSAQLKYNDDLTLYDIEFSYSPITELE